MSECDGKGSSGRGLAFTARFLMALWSIPALVEGIRVLFIAWDKPYRSGAVFLIAFSSCAIAVAVFSNRLILKVFLWLFGLPFVITFFREGIGAGPEGIGQAARALFGFVFILLALLMRRSPLDYPIESEITLRDGDTTIKNTSNMVVGKGGGHLAAADLEQFPELSRYSVTALREIVTTGRIKHSNAYIGAAEAVLARRSSSADRGPDEN